MNGTLFPMTNTPSGLQCVKNDAPHNGTRTSRAAAAKQTKPKRLRAIDRIRNMFDNAGRGGCIRDDCRTKLGIHPGTYCPRISEMMAMGELVYKLNDQGERVTCKTESNCDADVLILSIYATAEEQARP